MNTPNPIRYLSVCSGMEAASVAWEPLGFKAVGFSEIEPFPCAILKHRFPNTPNYGSLTEYQSWPIEQGTVDLLVGGTPCQSFSVAGLRRGLEDPRGNLALTFLGLADKLRPRWIVWENVPGVLSSNGGRDFASFLGALGQLGYGWAYRVLDAQYFGVPQRRRRVFVVATTSPGGGRLAGEVLSLPEGLRGYLETRKQKRKGAAADAGAGVEADGLQRTVGTLCADTHPGAYSGQDAYTGRLIPDQKPIVIDQDTVGTLCARDYKGVGNQYVQEGKCIPCEAPIPYRKSKRAKSTTDDESWVEGEVSNTLNNFDLTGDTRTTHAVVEPIAFSAKDNGGDATQGISPTLRSQNSVEGNQNSSWSIAIVDTVQHCSDVAPTVTSSGHPYSRTGNERVEAEALVTQPIAFTTEQTPKFNNDQALTLTKQSPTGGGQPQCVAQPITFQPGNLRREAGADPSTEATTTLKATPGDQMPHVAYPVGTDCYNGAVTGDVAATMGTSGSSVNAAGPTVMQSMAVRRLTPVECERLQGFPDNWSRIPWKGKPEEDCPDGPRYKACGNSMAVPVMAWIGKQIALVEKRIADNNR